MPVQIDAATHKQPSNPSNILGTSIPIQQFSIPHIHEKAIASSLHVASNMRWNDIFLSTESTGGSTTEGEEVVEDLCRWLITQTFKHFLNDQFSFSETKRNTAQNESLGESPLATVSLRFVNLIPYLGSLIKCLMIRYVSLDKFYPKEVSPQRKLRRPNKPSAPSCWA